MTPEEFKKELDELKMTYMSHDEFTKEIPENAGGIGVEIDLDTSVDYSEIIGKGMVIKLKTCRNDALYLIFQKYSQETKTLTMSLFQRLEEKYFPYHKLDCELKVGTTFPDICWYYSEGTTAKNKIEVETKFREEKAQLGDITWVLPTRFIDNIIETINLINQSPKFFNGLLRDSIVYGPYLV